MSRTVESLKIYPTYKLISFLSRLQLLAKADVRQKMLLLRTLQTSRPSCFHCFLCPFPPVPTNRCEATQVDAAYAIDLCHTHLRNLALRKLLPNLPKFFWTKSLYFIILVRKQQLSALEDILSLYFKVVCYLTSLKTYCIKMLIEDMQKYH